MVPKPLWNTRLFCETQVCHLLWKLLGKMPKYVWEMPSYTKVSMFLLVCFNVKIHRDFIMLCKMSRKDYSLQYFKSGLLRIFFWEHFCFGQDSWSQVAENAKGNVIWTRSMNTVTTTPLFLSRSSFSLNTLVSIFSMVRWTFFSWRGIWVEAFGKHVFLHSKQ